MLNDKIKTTGELDIVLRDVAGNIKQQITVPNLVVTAGKAVIASRLTGNTTSIMTHMAVGQSNVTQIAANTTLGGEVTLGRVALTVAGGVPVANEVTFSATFGAGFGTGVITEAGIFNDSIAGSMLCRSTFGAVNKDVGDSLSINWKITFS